MNEQIMTDEQIKKALEIHCNDKYDNCEGCPYLKGDRCTGYLVYSEPFRDILDLLNRKDAEIERLTTMNSELNIGIKNLKKFAVKEFAKRVKSRIHNSVYNYWNTNEGGYYLAEDVDDDIDDIVAEMVGDTDE